MYNLKRDPDVDYGLGTMMHPHSLLNGNERSSPVGGAANPIPGPDVPGIARVRHSCLTGREPESSQAHNQRESHQRRNQSWLPEITATETYGIESQDVR